MTEAKWLACNDPAEMLAIARGKVSARKMRLFAVACCRRVSQLLPTAGTSSVIDIAEQYADGLLNDIELGQCQSAAQAACRVVSYSNLLADPTVFAVRAAYHAVSKSQFSVPYAAKNVANAVAVLAGARTPQQVEDSTARQDEFVHQVAVLRDLVGPLFQTLTIDSRWLLWNDRTVPMIARGIYHERAFDRMPILADALEDAGCGDADILRHCREQGQHVRGCWVIDLLLGKE
jgi:hypothetical protein